MQSKKPIYHSMAFQMLVAIVLGAIIGYASPGFGAALNPLAVGFIKLIRMIVTIIIFLTVSVGIAHIGSVRAVGKLGIKSLVYFEVVSTLALLFGLLMVEVFQPGAGMHLNPAQMDAKSVASFASTAQSMSVTDFILNIIPASAVNAFATGSILQVLLFALFVGFALLHIGKRAEPLVEFLDEWTHVIFVIVGAIMKVAPLAVFGAVGFTIGKFGLGSMVSLGKLILVLYLGCILFVVIVLGTVSWLTKFNLWKFLFYIREELLLAFTTASSEAVLPRMIDKLENLGCARSDVGFVIPTGYSFNLDGSSLYLTMAAIFIAQATDTHLSLGQELTLLVIFLLTSKGVAGVTAAGFVVLAGTLTVFPDIPLPGLALLLGIDRFLDAMRTATNVAGNGVATLAIARWEGRRDDVRMRAVLNGEEVAEIAAAE
jgi:aerobic C4-dicarboxylate transport protein